MTGDCPVQCRTAGDFAYTVTVEDSGGLVSDLAGPVVQTTEATCPRERLLALTLARQLWFVRRRLLYLTPPPL